MINTIPSDLIVPIRIPTPLQVGDVYAYLIKDQKIVLIDCGQNSEDAFITVKQALRNQGLSLKDLDEVWLTHGHPDHYGQAAKLADYSEALLYGHRQERANFAGNNDAKLFEKLFYQHGIPSRYINKMVEQLEWLQQYQIPIEPQWIEEGDTLSSGKFSVDVKLTPGHAPGHVCYISNKNIIFGGDLLLEHISTNALINFDATTGKRNQSLLQYRKSLRWIGEQKQRVLPGHGKCIGNPFQLTRKYLNEQEERYRKICSQLIDGPLGLVELSRRIFPDAIKKEILFLALSEVLGYLDWAEAEGDIERTMKNGRFCYQYTRAF